MFSSKKPYTAITVLIDNQCETRYPEDDYSGIPDIIATIDIQSAGPIEAARAIRKKLKYGTLHQQLRALVILDGILQNGTERLQRMIFDEPLLERLRFCGTSDMVDQAVRRKCAGLFAGWSVQYKNNPALSSVAALYKELPKRKQQPTQAKSKIVQETARNPFEDDEDEPVAPTTPQTIQSSSKHGKSSSISASSGRFSASRLSSSVLGSESDNKKSKKNKKSSKKQAKAFNLEHEKDAMKSAIAESSVASTNLMNALKLINREREQVSQNVEVVQRVETCKKLRRQIHRYIQHVEAEQWLGALINANDDLINALMTFEHLDKSVDADSDSDDEAAEQAHIYRMAVAKGKENANISEEVSNDLAGLQLRNMPASPPKQPPRPAQLPIQSTTSSLQEPLVPNRDKYAQLEEEEDDPFGDSNAIETPAVEKSEPSWRVV